MSRLFFILAAAAALAGLGAAPAFAQHVQTYVACSYYDFNHEMNYRSRTFPVTSDLPQSADLSSYAGPFVAAIKAQYKVAVDLRHVECHTVGDWRVLSELTRQRSMEQDASLIPEGDRLVLWPQ